MKFIVWPNNKHWTFSLYIYLFFNYVSTYQLKGRLFIWLIWCLLFMLIINGSKEVCCLAK